jgi:hypothetical protein
MPHHLKFQFDQAKDSTEALAARVEELREGGARHLLNAKLRKADMEWWPRCLTGIADAIRAEAKAIATPDEELIAKIPEKELKDHYGYPLDRARLKGAQENYIRQARYSKPWVLYIAYLDRDADRILHEGILMGQKVIEARRAIRGFAAAVAVETGCAELVPDTRFEEYEESDPEDDSEDVRA